MNGIFFYFYLELNFVSLNAAIISGKCNILTDYLKQAVTERQQIQQYNEVIKITSIARQIKQYAVDNGIEVKETNYE